MPERTKSGKWKWGNVERNSRKELAQTVYGIWKGTGSKGSFHNFYHYGNGYRTAKKNKLRKEGYQLNPLLVEGKELDHILGTICDQREKSFMTACRKICSEIKDVLEVMRDDNCIYVYVSKKMEQDQHDILEKALNTLAKGFHFGRVDFFTYEKRDCFAIGSSPRMPDGSDAWIYVKESFNQKSLFFTKEVTSDDIKDICIRIKNNLDNPKINESRKEIMRKMYWELRLLRVKMRRNAVQKVPYKIVQSIIGK